jgi:alpha-glucosidase
VKPGPSVFPDFSKPAAREWWGGLYKLLTDVGVAGIWNDMNEPAVFTPYIHTMPTTVRHDNEGQPTDHREIHNVYGMLMTRSTFEGLSRLHPDERPFVLTRASFAGGQRYAAVWPGDNVSNWSHLPSPPHPHGPRPLGLSVRGQRHRGLRAGALGRALHALAPGGGVLPLHADAHVNRHAGPGAVVVRSAARGYQPSSHRAALRAPPPPLPGDAGGERNWSTRVASALPGVPEGPETYGIEDQFLLGRSPRRPVLREAVTEREVYLPAGDWYDYWTGRLEAGGRRLRVPVTLESIPIFVRSGGFLFRQPVVQHTGQMSGQALSVTVYPAARSEAGLYEDDGESLGYRRGAFARRRFSERREGSPVRVEASAIEGSWRPAPRDLVLRIRADSGRRASCWIGRRWPGRARPRLPGRRAGA